MKQKGIIRVLLCIFGLVVPFQNFSNYNTNQSSNHVTYPPPQSPIIKRNLNMLKGHKGDLHYNHPSYRSHNGESTPDMRVLLKNCNPVTRGNIDFNQGSLCFTAFRPEAAESPLMFSQVWEVDQLYAQPFLVKRQDLMIDETYFPWKSHICQSEQKNPTVCGPGNKNDCYDLDIVSFSWKVPRDGPGMYMTSKRVTVEVSEPKSERAYVSKVRIHSDRDKVSRKLDFTGFPEFSVTRDGKLFVARYSRSSVRHGWRYKNNRNRTVYAPRHILLYGYSSDPCDPEKWARYTTEGGHKVMQNMRPIAALPFDDRMKYSDQNEGTKSRYGLAHYPFRDTEGNLIPETGELVGNYPWVDWMGANLMFHANTGGPDSFCSEEGTCDNNPLKRKYYADAFRPGSWNSSRDWKAVRGSQSGTSVLGLWTHGKQVIIDGLLNAADFGMGSRTSTTDNVTLRLRRLYKDMHVDVSGTSGSVNNPNDWAPNKRQYWVKSGVRFSSLQNVFNYYPQMLPTSPRDVVWYMSRGHITDEVVFDDYLDPHVYIFSEMNASIRNEYSTEFRTHDGFRRTSDKNWKFYAGDIHIQNASTSPLYPRRPDYGRVVGESRVEPVAMGGIRGKGFWLRGFNKIFYNIQDAHEFRDKNFYMGLFVDSRSKVSKNERALLLSIPVVSKSPSTRKDLYLAMNMYNKTLEIIEKKPGASSVESVLKVIPLPRLIENRKWMHIGFWARPSEAEFDIFFNGNFVTTERLRDKSLLAIQNDRIFLGGRDRLFFSRLGGHQIRYQTLVGWIDEFRMTLNENSSLVGKKTELFCNYARGTMLAVQNSKSSLWDYAGRFPAQYARVRWASGVDAPRYACWKDYTRDYAVRVSNPPAHTLSLKHRILFPEGNLLADEPRPDSTDNGFCLTCHLSEKQNSRAPASMSVKALEFRSHVPMRIDPRRQPMQTPLNYGTNTSESKEMRNWFRSCLFGNFPARSVASQVESNVSYPAKHRSSEWCANSDIWTN